MSSNEFDLKISDLHWLINTDEQNDLCCHGTVQVKIGDESFCNDDTAVSATALYLLRTIKKDYKIGDFNNPLLPHCGHFFIPVDEISVEIQGCPIGVEWTIIHTKDNKIKHISESGAEAVINKEVYKNLVFDFADQVESFYQNSLPKILPEDDFNKNGYLAFWNEWKKLRNEFSN